MPTPPLATTGTVTAIGDRAGQREVVAVAGAVAVHRGDEQFARAELGEPQRVRDRVDPGRAAAAVGEDFPAARPTRRASTEATTHWLPKRSAISADHFGPRDRGGIDRDLVRAGEQQRARILDACAPRRRRSAA